MSHRVFISYARSSSASEAGSLAKLLGEQVGQDAVFLDTAAIDTGEEFPSVLADAVLDAQIVVVIADARYFERWYCLRELRLALVSPEQIVVALGEGPDLALLPGLTTRNWPQAKNTNAVAELVKRRLDNQPSSIRSRDTAKAQLLFQITIEESRLPQPLPIPSEIPTAGQIAVSIGDRFVGRSDDLARVHFALSGSSGGAGSTAVITAAGGFGKTRLALEYLHRYGPRHYPGGLFWVEAGGNVSLEEQFYSVLSALRRGDVPPLPEMRAKQTDIRAELATALRSATRPVLYIVDNVPEVPSGTRPRALSEFCPAMGGLVTVLATSRQRSFDQHIKAVTVGTQQRESSVALLTHDLVAPGALGPDEWAAVAAWVGDLPLALDLLNRSLHLGLAPDRLLARVRSSSTTPELDRQASTLKTQVSEDALRGITETFAISLEALDEPARRCAFALSTLAETPIPERLVDALPGDTDRVRADLVARHFVTGQSALVFGTMHRLLADFLQSSFKGLQPIAEAVHALIDAMDPEVVEQPQSWPEMILCEPHGAVLLYGLINLLGAAMKAEDADDVRTLAVDAFDITGRLSLLARSRGDYARSNAVMEAIYPLMRRVFGDSNRRTLTVCNNVAENARQLGDLDRAQSILEQVVDIQRRTYGEEDPQTLKASGNLALVYSQQGKLLAAEPLEEHLMQVSQRLYGAESEQALRAMANLAVTLSRKGDLARARALQEHVLEVRTRTLGTLHVDTLRAATNLARSLVAQGDGERARHLLTPVLPQAERVLGEAHPEVLNMANTLSSAL